MSEIQAGDYIVNKEMEMEGIVVSLRPANRNPERVYRATIFCTRDKVYPPNVGQTFGLVLNDTWKTDNNREFR